MTRFNNKILFILLIVMVGGFILSKLFRSPGRERNVEENLLSLDTARITEIQIFPSKDKQGAIRLVRSGNDWQVLRDEMKARAERNSVVTALASLHEIHPEREVSRKKEKWATYHVDSSGTQIKVFTGKKEPEELWVGTTNNGTNYVRMAGKEDVYEVKEMLNSYFNKNFNAWRDRSFLRVQTDKVSKITFTYPGDSSFVVKLENNKWTMNGLKADSSKVETYLNKFRQRNLSEFADDFKPDASPSLVVTLSDHSAAIATVKAWKLPENKWALTSSLQDSVYFSSDQPTLIKELFVGKKSFMSK